MSRFKRFMHLEAPRADRSPDAPRPTEERFSKMEEERVPSADLPPPPPPPPPGGTAERIQRQVSAPPLVLEGRPGTEEQLFIRCMRCEADNSRYAQECAGCGLSLHTPEQRAFNQSFFRKRQELAQQEAEETRKFRKARAEVEQKAQEEAAERRKQAALATADYMLRGELDAQNEARRLPPGVRLIQGIKDGTLQWVAIFGFLLAAVVMGLILFRGLKTGNSTPLGVGFFGLLFLAWMFTPPRWWTSRRRRGWWHDDDGW